MTIGSSSSFQICASCCRGRNCRLGESTVAKLTSLRGGGAMRTCAGRLPSQPETTAAIRSVTTIRETRRSRARPLRSLHALPAPSRAPRMPCRRYRDAPRWTIHELLQKQCRRNRAAPSAARILHVRPLAADQFLVIVPLGQSPDALTYSLPTLNQLLSQLIAVAEQPRRLAAERDDTSAGERRVIDD